METVEVKTSELIGPALDWAVAQLESETEHVQFSALPSSQHYYAPSRKWAQGGPLIERERICVGDSIHPDDNWTATIYVPDEEPWQLDGPTPLIAAMRCLVAAKLGDTVQVPKELLSA